MTKTCIYCGKECKEERIPNSIGFSRYNIDYICDNPECKHFGEVMVY